MDLHAGQVQGFFQRPVDHMTALMLLTTYFRDLQLHGRGGGGGPRRRPGQAQQEAGAARVFAAATHGVFSGSAYDNLAASAFERIVVTDTIPLRAGAPANVSVLSCVGLLTDSIRRIFTGESVSEVFDVLRPTRGAAQNARSEAGTLGISGAIRCMTM